MKRRQFLRTASTVGTIALVPVAVQAAANAGAIPRFALLRADAGQVGARFGDPACRGAACSAERVRVRIDGLHRADGALVLQELRSLHQALDKLLTNRALDEAVQKHLKRI